ncbi:hypothetical protein J7F03_31065 [Streptomyces sp. ISL-43]|uniref:NB-ARC domain-containing protein n=1 Tax=Streptomyces sp. ISL-43 TaxID=2819183 RepID=UPI001BEC3F05|nr:NB-ARC domain-containing protein [Streptomyces sp. ISL-43]MBT2451427.1 hypothetical protein [Streptomyces sp. ISL-43]
MLGILVPALAAASAVAVNAATSVEAPWPWGLEVLRRNPWAATAVLTVACIGAALLTPLLQRGGAAAGSDDPPPPPLPDIPDWVVERPSEAGRIVKALCRRGGTVGITTALHGAGGFGKTTLADVVARDERVQRFFRGRVYRITLGRDVRDSGAIAAKVNETIGFITGQESRLEDPALAGQHLGRLLEKRGRTLLVIDDVWEEGHLAPFVVGGGKCVRLVTTRVASALPDGAARVRVDQMSTRQAHRLLTWGIPVFPPVLAEQLLAATGRWPLLLRLINRVLSTSGADPAAITASGHEVLERLRGSGPAALDHLATAVLDLDDPQQRARAVRATIRASTELLPAGGEQRMLELGIFAEDEMLAPSLAASLWRSTANLDSLEGQSLFQDLVRLSLITEHPELPGRPFAVHDVVRDFARAELGPQRLTTVNRGFVDALAAGLPTASALPPNDPSPVPAWWHLPAEEHYLWDHLLGHLIAAGQPDQAEHVACDLRWAEARLLRSGPGSPHADLSAAGTPRAFEQRATWVQVMPLLSPTEPRNAVLDVLRTALSDSPHWGPQIARATQDPSRARLTSRWPLPDVRTDTLRRTFPEREDGPHPGFGPVALSPDGTRVIAGEVDGHVVVLDAATGRRQAAHKVHRRRPSVLAVSPDGAWCVSAAYREAARMWSLESGLDRPGIRRLPKEVEHVAFSGDGTWFLTLGPALASPSGERGRRVELWDASSGRSLGQLPDQCTTFAISPNSTWIVTGHPDGRIALWDVASKEQRAGFALPNGGVSALAVSPDATWIAAGSSNNRLRILDAADGSLRAELTLPDWDNGYHHFVPGVAAVAIAPDGSWLAAGNHARKVVLWTRGTDTWRRTLSTQVEVDSLAISPDSSWFVVGGGEGRPELWEAAAVPTTGAQTPHSGSRTAVLLTADRTRIVTAGDDGVNTWDPVTGSGTPDRQFAGRLLAVSPDGRLLAAADARRVRLWQTGSALPLINISQDHPVLALAIRPDGGLTFVSSGDDRVRLWDARTIGLLREIPVSATASPVVSRDGRWLAMDNAARGTRIWDLAADRLHGEAAVRGRPVGFSHDGTRLAIARDGSVTVWDVPGDAAIAELTATDALIQRASFSQDGAHMAAVAKNMLSVWHLDAPQPVAATRTPRALVDCVWLEDGTGIAATGVGGLYVLDFQPASRR